MTYDLTIEIRSFDERLIHSDNPFRKRRFDLQNLPLEKIEKVFQLVEDIQNGQA